MPRPRKDGSYQICVRVSPDAYARLVETALAYRLKPAAYLRALAEAQPLAARRMHARRTDADTRELLGLVADLSRGVRAIARLADAARHLGLPPVDVAEIESRLRAVVVCANRIAGRDRGRSDGAR